MIEKITITIPGLLELTSALHEKNELKRLELGLPLSTASSAQTPVETPAPVQAAPITPQAQPVPVAPVQMPPTAQPPVQATTVQTAPPVSQTAVPVAPVTPAAVPTTALTYTMDDLARAAMALMDSGRQPELLQLLAGFGVQTLPELPKEQYGAFATALRGMGAQI